jgi:HlyD family secretion protein
VKHDLTLITQRAIAQLEVAPNDDPFKLDDPSPEVRWGMRVAVLFFVVLLGWAAVTPLDASSYAEGRVSVSGQRQSVQHRDGGVVGALLVQEGQAVGKDEVLVQLAAPEAIAQERALSSQYIALLAKQSRLRAEQLGVGEVERPLEFAALPRHYQSEAESALQLEMAQLRTGAALIAAQRNAIDQRAAVIDREADGYRSQAAAAREQRRLIDEELSGLKEVAETGFVSKNRIRALERTRAELAGQQGSYQATVARSQEGRSEARLRSLEIVSGHRDSIASEMRDVELALRDVHPRLVAARDQLDRTSIRAPEGGKIVGLSVFTVGGVVSPGQKLMDIVPDRATLVVEARLAAQDIDEVFVGKEARVRFSGLHERSIRTLKGHIVRVSADSFVDDRTGQSYFNVEMRIPPDQLNVVREVRGENFTLHPGMPAQVLIPLRKRTALQYLLEPLFSGMWASFREQ